MSINMVCVTRCWPAQSALREFRMRQRAKLLVTSYWWPHFGHLQLRVSTCSSLHMANHIDLLKLALLLLLLLLHRLHG
jgi:hypothetical protein